MYGGSKIGKTVKPRERIVQRSIGFRFRQIEFFNKYPEFKPDTFCRDVIDEQIAQIDNESLTMEETKNDKNNETEEDKADKAA